jgi:hypothetical protein
MRMTYFISFYGFSGSVGFGSVVVGTGSEGEFTTVTGVPPAGIGGADGVVVVVLVVSVDGGVERGEARIVVKLPTSPLVTEIRAVKIAGSA